MSCGVRDQPCWGMGGNRGARWDGMMSREGTWGDHDGTPKVPVRPQSSETLCTPPLWMTRQRRRRRREACPGEGTHCPERWGCSHHACKNKHNGPSSNVGQTWPLSKHSKMPIKLQPAAGVAGFLGERSPRSGAVRSPTTSLRGDGGAGHRGGGRVQTLITVTSIHGAGCDAS